MEDSMDVHDEAGTSSIRGSEAHAYRHDAIMDMKALERTLVMNSTQCDNKRNMMNVSLPVGYGCPALQLPET